MQTDGNSCGFHVLQWTEEQYRLLRGEGQFRLTEKFTNQAADLNRFFKAVMILQHKESKQAAKSGPLPLAGPPLSQSELFGCSRCRYAKTGCLSCNPEKALRAVEKAQAKPV